MSSHNDDSGSTAQPTPPKQQNEYSFLNGVQQSSRVYDKSKGGYVDNTYLTPDQQKAYDTGNQAFSSAVQQLSQMPTGSTPAQHDAFVHQLYDPQAANLRNEYDKTLGQAVGNANSNGMLDSIGFQDYRAKTLDKTLNQGLSDLYNQADVQAYDLPSIQQQPLINLVNAYMGVGQSGTNTASSLLNPAFQGSQSSNNTASQIFQDQQNQYLANLSKPKSFFGSLF